MKIHSLLFVLFFISSCWDKKPEHLIDLEVLHLENIYITPPDSVNHTQLRSKYGGFWDIYRQYIVQLPMGEDFSDSLSAFQNSIYYQEVYSEIQSKYKDFSSHEEELEQAFSIYHEHFPNHLIPSVITFFGAFNFPVAVTDSTIGIGLEMFLGKNSEYYKALQTKYPIYMHQRFQPENLTAMAVSSWLETEYPVSYQDFLTQMIHHGKLKYCQQILLPNTPDSILMGYNEKQIQWCEDNEYAIWKFLIDKGLLYSNDQTTIIKYINPAPFSKGMPTESPGQVAQWVGWQIVKEFMDKNSFTLEQLLSNNNAQFILQQSSYKPN